MVWVARLGSALLIDSGPCMHLHIVCSPPMDFTGYPPQSCLLVSVSTQVPKCDSACLLDPGVHPFVVHPSFVHYRSARLVSAAELERKVAEGPFKAQPDADHALVKRILACIDVSDMTPGGMVKVGLRAWDQCRADGYW
jgi:hypothetical protein